MARPSAVSHKDQHTIDIAIVRFIVNHVYPPFNFTVRLPQALVYIPYRL